MAVLLAGPVFADDPVGVSVQTVGVGSPQVQIFGSTNVSSKVVVQVTGPDGKQSVQVYNGSSSSPAASGIITATATLADPETKVMWLGVTTEPASDELRAQLSLDPGVGLTIHAVSPESPAAQAGLQPHDVLVRFADQKLMGAEQLRNLVLASKPGDKVKLTYIRKGREETVTATLAEHADSGSGEIHAIDLGDFNLDLRKIMGQFPKFRQDLSNCTTSFATNFNWGSGSMSMSSAGTMALPPIVHAFAMTDTNLAQSVAEMLKGMSHNDTNLTKIIEETLKEIRKQQSNTGP